MNRLPWAFLLLASPVWASSASDWACRFPEAKAVWSCVEGFPMLAGFLALNDPWGLAPGDLATRLFPAEVKRVQGSDEYPLLFCGQRSSQWPGLPVWNQVAYETEFYTFDPSKPVIRLHLGRPLDAGIQYTDYSLSDETKAMFPPLEDSARQEMADHIRRLVEALRPYGAKELPFRHPRIHAYLLPGGTRLTFSDFTGTGRGSVYMQIDLEPAARIASPDRRRLPAFPGAEGYGAYTPGGRGGRVYVVTTLEDYLSERRDGRKETRGEPARDGTTPVLPAQPEIPAEKPIPGSLREAVEASGPRIIVFAVSGTIELKSQLKIRNPYVTIAGNTAPGEGVQIRNWGLEIMTHDVVLRYLRLRVGDIKGPGKMPRVLGDQTHALDISGCNIVIDHCEFAYANDQLVNIYAQRTPQSRAAVTFQWNYVYAGLTRSVHEGGNHSHYCAMGGWGWASFHHNLSAFCLGRNPRVSGLALDYRNNVHHYYWDSGYGDSTVDFLKLNYVGNVLEHGKRREAFFDGMHHICGQFYAADNLIRNVERKGSPRVLDVPPETLMDAPFEASPVETQEAKTAYADVLRWSGASLPSRDLITTFVVNSVRNNTGAPAGTTDDWPVRGYPIYGPAVPPADGDHDGMPDKWETRGKLDPQDSSDASQDKDGDGYTNIEEYINGTDPGRYVDYRDPANNRDPRRP